MFSQCLDKTLEVCYKIVMAKEIRIYRKARPLSKTGKARPPMIEIGDGIHRPRFYAYSPRREARVIAAIERLPLRLLISTKYSLMYVSR